MRRPLFVAMSLFLGVVSIAVALASISLTPARVNQSANPPDTAVVTRYYGAVNHMIATGDPDPLREVVHPEMIGEDEPATGLLGLAGIENHLMFLHRATPEARIEPELVTGERDLFTALVSLRRESVSTMLGFTLDDRSVLWPEIERFRVVDDLIVERRASWDGLATLELVSDLPVEVAIPQNQLLTVSLNSYAPRAIGYYYPVDAPDMLQVLSGEISVRASKSQNQPGFMFDPGAVANDAVPFAAGQSQTVPPGSVMIMPPGSGFFVANGQTQPATVLNLTVPFVPPPSEHLEQISSTSRPGVFVQELAKLAHLDRAGTVEVSFGEASLMPGGRLTVDPSTKLLVVCTENGALRCVSYEPGSGQADLVRTDPYQDDSTATVPMWLLMRNEADGTLMNAGAEPISVWILAVATDADSGG